MKFSTYILFIITMVISCSGNQSSQNLTWYNNSVISDITDDPDRPQEFARVSIGISAQVFYLSKKSQDYTHLIEKATLSLKTNKKYDIGIENKTNIIRQIKDPK
ncbi:MAG TPA: hypothetical protein DCQ50_03665 [Chryseobacterium sp.]|nr:hypothetical protein [Chryseobacterium sp.]